MHTQFSELSVNILSCKIKTILYSIGLSEKYNAFNYLCFILTYLIVQHNDSFQEYKIAINLVTKQFNVSERTTIQSVNKILKSCTNQEITNKFQFKILSKKTLNQIRVIKSYVEHELD